MTRVDFYQLNPERHNLHQIVGQLCQKAYDSKQYSLLLTQSEEQTSILDKHLWVHQQDSFLPHDTEEDETFKTPILIQHQANPKGERDILFNLTTEIPPFFAQFGRVIEFVTEENKSQSRQHYQFYRERGYPLQHHTL